MTGFEAINHHNGWMMALFGAAIVFSGLAVLSFVIAQLPKVFALFERKEAPPAAEKVPEKKPPTVAAGAATDAEQGELDPKRFAAALEPLVKELDDPFQLADLYRLCRAHDLPHPHLTLSTLQRQGILVFQGGGDFTWNTDSTTAQEG